MIDIGKKTRNLYLIFLLFALILYGLNMFIVKWFYTYSTKKIILNNAHAKSLERESVIKDFFDHSEKSIKFLRESMEFGNYIAGFGDEDELVYLFSSFLRYNPEMMQIRFIDKTGKEKIRVEREMLASDIVISDTDSLQDKSDRYYFTDSLKRRLEKVWFTSIDANIEHGVIQEPYTPTTRAVLPVGVRGEFVGVLVVNQFVSSMIERLVFTTLYNCIIYDDDGNIIYHPEISEHMLHKPDSKANIKDHFPDSFRNILSSNQLVTEEFAARKLNVPVSGGLNLLLTMKKSYLEEQKAQARSQYLIVSVVIFVFSVFLAVFIVKRFSAVLLNVEESKKLNDKLNYASVVAKIGFWELDSAGKIDWSEGVYDIFEIEDKRKIIDLETFLSHINEKDRDSLNEEFRKSIENKEDYYFVHEITTEKGNIRYVQERAKHSYDSKGNFVMSVGSAYDITERYLAELKYRLILDLASDGIFIMDERGRLIESSNRAAEMLGYTPEEMENLSVYDWDKDIVESEYKGMLAMLSRGYLTIERKHTRKDGSVYDAQITSSKFSFQNESYVYASVRDVTLLKEKEKQVISQRDELETIFDTALEGLAILDTNGYCLKTNKKYCEILGFTEEELVGKCVFKLPTIDYSDRLREIIKEVVNKGSYENFERDYKDLEGNVKRLKSSLVLMPGRKEILVTTVDYTALYKAYKQIEEQSLTDELTKLYNRKSFNMHIAELLELYKRYGAVFSAVMLDIDHFKSINDTYGHDVGDAVLKELGALIKHSARASDYPFRLGGEEFIILLPNTSAESAAVFAENVRKRIETELNTIPDKVITASFGIAESCAEDTAQSIYKRADSCLYTAKQNGRNRVES